METRIICNIKSCKHRVIYSEFIEGEDGICNQETIRLQGCAPDADNVVACSEFEDKGE